MHHFARDFVGIFVTHHDAVLSEAALVDVAGQLFDKAAADVYILSGRAVLAGTIALKAFEYHPVVGFVAYLYCHLSFLRQRVDIQCMLMCVYHEAGLCAGRLLYIFAQRVVHRHMGAGAAL